MKFKTLSLIIALLLITACAKGVTGPTEDIETPEGTIIGNPAPSAPPAGTFNVYTDAGALRYRVVVQVDGAADVTILNDDGTVQETTSGRFVRIETAVNSATFVLEFSLSDGSLVTITLTSNTDNAITGVSLSVNGQPASATVEFVMPGGAATTFTLTGDASIEPPPPCPSATECFSLAMTALGNAQVTSARVYFDQTTLFDRNHSGGHFGSALTRIIQLVESAPSLALQDGLGQERFTVGDALGPDSYLDQLNQRNAGTRMERPDRTRFPYGYFERTFDNNKFSLGDILALARNGFTAEDVQQNLAALRAEMDPIIDSLESAHNDVNFQFTIPGSLYVSSNDIVIGRADVTLLLSSFYFAQSGLSFANTWSFDIDLGILYTVDGEHETDPGTLIGTFNQFFRIRSLDELAEAQATLANGLSTFIEGVSQLPTHPAPGIFDTSVVTAAGWDDLADLAQAINESFGGLTALPGTSPMTSINLSNLFADPPDLDDIGIDPFVLNSRGRIEPVEAFFQQMINRSLVGYTIGQRSFDILNNVIRQSFYQNLFSEFRDFTVSGENLWESR